MTIPKVTLYEDKDYDWRWRMTNRGQIIADSGQGYSRKYDAKRAANRFLQLAPTAVVLEGEA
jgi:uncharacterized protein YegP (UPF0339 family)